MNPQRLEASMSDISGDPAQLIPANSKLRSSRRLWRVLFFLALAVAVLAVAGRFAFDAQSAVGDRIARIKVDGVIATDPVRLKALKDLGEDDKVKAVIVAINSPGGTTAGGEELYEAISALREKKPVVAVISELGASAAYMTAIATDRIFARRLSIVGSIGVLYQHVDASKLLSTIGIDLDKVSTGPLKAEPDYDEPMPPQVRASLQALVDDSFQWFVDIVAERRGIQRPQTLALSDGRIITGRQGVDSKLIDAIGGEAEAIAWLEADKAVAAKLPVYTYYPQPKQNWLDVGQLLGQSARAALGLGETGPIALDGLVSLWQVGPSM
ncbi:MAG: signal peptide peptidase SppA [Hyphomicrobiales bacterium]|nr:MAG: signal peptide peptidase SppA [Hyphomicrobiales bacterium]